MKTLNTKIIHSNLTNNDLNIIHWDEKWITQFTINDICVELDRAKTKELIKFLKKCTGKEKEPNKCTCDKCTGLNIESQYNDGNS